MPDLKCPKCDRPYRCPRCNGDRLWLAGFVYDTAKFICSDCKFKSAHCFECKKEKQEVEVIKAELKKRKASKPKRRWGNTGF